MSEFDLIRKYFTRPTPSAELGVGDDAALLKITEGKVLAISTDMLVSGTHFLPNADAFQLGHKTLAVNLSDLAAMGAVPRWATLSLSLPFAQSGEACSELPHPNPLPEGDGTNEALCASKPTIDEEWLRRFSEGFFALADDNGVELIGGDTTRGPLNLCVTIMGEVPRGKALRRDGAKVGDDIWVSGKLGQAALGLANLQGKFKFYGEVRDECLKALHQPQPRVSLGLALRGIANSAIDISDGLHADLGHILECSHVGAEIEVEALPIVDDGVEKDVAQQCALAGGDDYELCFTAPENQRDVLMALAEQLKFPLTRIGHIKAELGCVVRDGEGKEMQIEKGGYDHFA
ncbi:MAG: thiL [Gallionellaceae bacterium]|nr:MAG: thiL [Gallionellaceae bacterium]